MKKEIKDKIIERLLTKIEETEKKIADLQYYIDVKDRYIDELEKNIKSLKNCSSTTL